MAATTITKQAINPGYDWAKQVKEFEDTKAGVKGLVDSGITTLPRFLIHPPESLENPPQLYPLELPTVDLEGVLQGGGAARRREAVVEEIRMAAAEWGFFWVVNHGVPSEVMEGMLEAVRRFHEQRSEDKAENYSGDSMQRVRFTNNLPAREFDAANWKNILFCFFHDDYLDPQAIPLVCRKELQEYVKCMIKLRETMAELLSEALGLSSHYLSRMECMKSELLASLCYPICPEPRLTLGTPRHSDINFLTLLLQDISGLQVRHKNQWVDVPPLPGTLIANIGDLMQIISNDKFISVEHRVLAQPIGPRVSVACFFTPISTASAKPFGPIKVLLSDENPAIYRECLFSEYYTYYVTKGKDVISPPPHFKI